MAVSMLHRTSLILMVALATCLLLRACVGMTDDDLGDLAAFIYARIPELQGQARDTGRGQFAALIFLDQTEVEDPEKFQFGPHHNDGTPWVDNTKPFSPTSPINYVAAHPEDPQHAEEILLDQLPNMWNTYISQGTHSPPAMILLFTRLYPCTLSTPGGRGCSEKIRNTLEQAPYNTVPSRVVAYNSDEPSPVPDQNANDMHFLFANIPIHGLPMGDCFSNQMSRAMSEDKRLDMSPDTPDMCMEPSTIQSLQGCVLQCVGDEPYSCVDDLAVTRQKAYLMNILIDKCLLIEPRELCFKTTFLAETGDACTSLQKMDVANDLAKCHQECNLKPISKPCQDAWDFDNDIALLTNVEERYNYQEPSPVGCQDTRHTGLLCTYIDDSSVEKEEL